ncbi:hypothetical protein FNV43_RR06117 [Rhamnella rubrinervis]|uniref:Uncharacterized protein n=1 Tax=Rhamnella rubrinervis TaxID=2594499 RepID=A0A8K0MLG8_9ROSA|nr:hypothetical protein FNV43_RR06117 [Rhamnella rubrinervis]
MARNRPHHDAEKEAIQRDNIEDELGFDNLINIFCREKDGPADLIQVSWLEVTGTTDPLDVGKYEVGFRVTIKVDAFGWKNCQVFLMAKVGKKGRYNWKKVSLEGLNNKEIPEDKFQIDVKPENDDKQLYFGLYEVWSGKWKGEKGTNVQSSASDLSVTPSRAEFNTDVGKSVRITAESIQTLSYHSTTPRQVTSWADTFGDSDDELGDDANDIVEDEWPPLKGEGSSGGQQSNSMAMVLFDSCGALTAAQQNLNLIVSQPSVLEPTDQDLWNMVKRKPGRPKKDNTTRRLQISTTRLGLTKPFTRDSRHTTLIFNYLCSFEFSFFCL